jgi:H+/Cl- antiporter ClcA
MAGELMRMTWGPTIQPGTYALIGAASMLSGVCRITITLTVILYETTDQVRETGKREGGCKGGDE